MDSALHDDNRHTIHISKYKPALVSGNCGCWKALDILVIYGCLYLNLLCIVSKSRAKTMAVSGTKSVFSRTLARHVVSFSYILFIFFSIYFLFKFKKFLRYYPLKLFKNRMSDGTIRHFYAEVVSNCGSNHRKSRFLLNCAAALHAL